MALRKNNSCHCFQPVPCIYPLFHFQHCSTLVLKVSASLSFTPLLEQLPYYEKLLTVPLTFSTGLRCHQTYQDRLEHKPGLCQLLDICKHFHQSYPFTRSNPLALRGVPLVPLLQRRKCFYPPQPTRAGSSTPSLLTSLAAGTCMTNPQVPSIPPLSRSCTWDN